MRLVVEGLCVGRGERRVLDGVDFVLETGEVLAITGPNGAGKSTLLRTLAGLIDATAGTVRLDGWGGDRLATAMHLVAHQNAIKLALTASENLVFWRRLLGPASNGAATLATRDRAATHDAAAAAELGTLAADQAAAAPGLDTAGANDAAVETALDCVALLPLAETPAEFLSQGQRRRLALARLLVAPRPLWLLDEPTAGLDAASREKFAALMGEHLAGGGLILAATHDPLGLAARHLALAADGSARPGPGPVAT